MRNTYCCVASSILTLLALAACSSAQSIPVATLPTPAATVAEAPQDYSEDPTTEIVDQSESAVIGTTSLHPLSAVATAQPTPHLSNPQGGPVITSAKIYAIDINNPASFFGDVSRFWTSMNTSSLLHVLDQYVGTTADGRYPFSGSFEVKGVKISKMTEKTIANLLAPHVKDGDGLNAIYNIYLPPGANLVYKNGTSPQITPTGGCAFHGYMDVKVKKKLKHFIYAAYTYPGNCSLPQWVNSPVIDNAANMTAHEDGEAITDPNISSWYAPGFGEIADICGWDKRVYTLSDSSQYFIQDYWSNVNGACTFDVNATPVP